MLDPESTIDVFAEIFVPDIDEPGLMIETIVLARCWKEFREGCNRSKKQRPSLDGAHEVRTRSILL